MSEAALQALVHRFGTAIRASGSQHRDEWAYVQPDRIVEVCTWLRDHPEWRFELLIDLTVVDYLDYESPREVEERFEVVYHLRSQEKNVRLRLKVTVDIEQEEIDSVTPVWPAANWYEREAWDLYGIRFRGHPDLRRILLYEEFEGFPLRKDYPKERAQPLVGPDHTPVRPFLQERDLMHGPPVAVGSPWPADGSRSGPRGRLPSPATLEERAGADAPAEDDEQPEAR